MIFTYLAMLFCHVVDDFCLQQPFLAKGKQRSWWAENTPDRKYCFDWFPCLLAHSLSWAFAVMLPIAWKLGFEVDGKFVLIFLLNAAVHGVIDHLKANLRLITLVTDQLLHYMQISITFMLLKDGLV